MYNISLILVNASEWKCPMDGSNRHCPGINLLVLDSLSCEEDKDCDKHQTAYEVKCCDDSCFKRKLCRFAIPLY